MTEQVQVAIVGAGPAGLVAAESLARAGARVVVFDEQNLPGGQLRYRLGEIRTERGVASHPPHFAAELAARARAAGAEIRCGHRVWGLFANHELGIESAGEASVVRAERVLLATGSLDRALPFTGGSLPGVFTGRAVQILLNVQYVRPGRRFAVIADEPDAAELAREIELAGGEVVAVLPTVADGLRAAGESGVERISGPGFNHEVDVVVVAAGRMADAGLAFMAECAAGYSADFGGFVPRIDASFATSVPGLYLAGDCAGPTTPEIALLEGNLAGLAIAESLGLTSSETFTGARARYAAVAPARVTALSAVTGSFVQVDRLPLGSVTQ